MVCSNIHGICVNVWSNWQRFASGAIYELRRPLELGHQCPLSAATNIARLSIHNNWVEITVNLTDSHDSNFSHNMLLQPSPSSPVHRTILDFQRVKFFDSPVPRTLGVSTLRWIGHQGVLTLWYIGHRGVMGPRCIGPQGVRESF